MNNPELRHEEILGALDKRLINLENGNHSWERWFGHKPFAVLGIVIAALATGGYWFHTWTIERIDRKHSEDIAAIEKRSREKVDWLKEQHTKEFSSIKERCDFEKDKVINKLTQCEYDKGLIIKSKETNRKSKS